jgi:hypothetical protein
MAIAAAGLAIFLAGVGFLRKDAGGQVDAIRLQPLNERILPRTIERLKTLKDVHDGGEGWLSKDMWQSLTGALQALSSDTGFAKPEFFVAVDLSDSRTLETERFDLDLEPEISGGDWTLALPEEIPMKSIRKISLLSRVNYIKGIGTTLEEESLSVDDDAFRQHVRTWHGRIFSIQLLGPPRPYRTAGWSFLIIGGLTAMAGLSILLFQRQGRT